MFQFPSLPSAPYVFRYGSQRITTGGFPHSEISGSKVGQHLTRAYRSRPRPSSALGAKASTVCSYSLDREEHTFATMEFSRCARAHRPPNEKNRCPVRHRSLKTQQRSFAECRRDLGGPSLSDGQQVGHQRARVRSSGNCHWDP